MTVTLRRAEPGECGALSGLAVRSKAHWGYDEDFLAACRAELTLDPALVERHRVAVAEESGEIVGFSALAGAPPVGELTFLFVEPAKIGAGIGRVLWGDCVATAARAGLSAIRIESDPNASAFYTAMGAALIGEAPSQSIPDRRLPVLSFDMAEVPIELRPVEQFAGAVEVVLADVRRVLGALAPGVDVEHIGATSMPDGVTKGDVDVNLRVDRERFDAMVVALSARFDIAQPRN